MNPNYINSGLNKLIAKSTSLVFIALALLVCLSAAPACAQQTQWETKVIFNGTVNGAHTGPDTVSNKECTAYTQIDTSAANDSNGAEADVSGTFTVTWTLNCALGDPAQPEHSDYYLSVTYGATMNGSNDQGYTLVGSNTYTNQNHSETAQNIHLQPHDNGNGTWSMSWTTPTLEGFMVRQYRNQASTCAPSVSVSRITLPMGEGSGGPAS